jgi:long-chain acyl-CoA synthetase
MTTHTSVYTAFKNAAEDHRDKIALRWKHDTTWKQCTYHEFLEKVDAFADSLIRIGVKRKDKIAIWSENRPEWLMADLALNKIGAISVPIHTTSNEDSVLRIIAHSESVGIILSGDMFDKGYSLPKDTLKMSVCFDRKETKEKDLFIHCISFETLTGGKDISSKNDPYKLASIVYTSGTTGAQKGAMITNRNFLSNIESSCDRFPIYKTDIFLSFLPLSHILERTAGSYVPITQGATIAYATSVKNLLGELSEIRPTMLIAVPKIFERFHEGVFMKVEEGSAGKKKLFYWAMKQSPQNKIRFALASILVHRKIRSRFGSRLRTAISGGASLQRHIIKFFFKVGVPIIEGYGLTETTAAITVNKPSNPKPGSVGVPIRGIDVRITKEKEIIAKGPLIFEGYWNNPAETKRVFSDEWFHTGDLGYIDEERNVYIIGRAKEIIVTKNGKNIIPETIESVLNESHYIEQSLVVGHKRDHLVALIVPQMDTFKKENILPNSMERTIHNDIERINRKLPYHEHVRSFAILEKPFTIESGDLTPTLKIRRLLIEKKYIKVIDRLYR